MFFSWNPKSIKMDDYMAWIKSTFVENYFLEKDYMGGRLDWASRRFLADGTSYRLGPARLRQFRTPSGNLVFGF